MIYTSSVDESKVQVTVEDTGIGLDANMISKIFDPFFTTKSSGMGMVRTIDLPVDSAEPWWAVMGYGQ